MKSTFTGEKLNALISIKQMTRETDNEETIAELEKIYKQLAAVVYKETEQGG